MHLFKKANKRDTSDAVWWRGKLSMMRRDAAMFAKRAGARVRAKVTSETNIMVQGAVPPRGWKADAQGQKGLDADHEREQGHDIQIIGE